MTDKEILSLKRKINKARMEISTILETLQSSIDDLKPDEEDMPISDDEAPF